MAFCKNCGTMINDKTNFCPSCGAYVNKESGTKTIQLLCKSCGGIMTIDNNREVLSCPYCGSKEIVTDSDAVAVEKIRSNTYKEVEYKKWEREDEKEKRQQENDALQKYKKSKLGKATIVFAIICGIITMFAFYRATSSYRVYPIRWVTAFIGLAQTLLFISSAVVRSLDSKGRLKYIPIILTVIGLILFIPLLNVCAK